MRGVTEDVGDDRFRFWLRGKEEGVSALTGGRDGEKNTEHKLEFNETRGKVSVVDKWICCSSGGEKSDEKSVRSV